MSVDQENESEENHGKFEEAKARIMSKRRIVESLMGEEPSKTVQRVPIGTDEDPILLAK